MSQIRNIVFDMGNVMIQFDPAAFIDRENITDPEDRKLINTSGSQPRITLMEDMK